VEQRTLAAVALLLFDESSGRCDDTVSAAGEGKQHSDSAVSLSLDASTTSHVAAQVCDAIVSLQAPTPDVLQKLRASVLALEELSLVDLEMCAGSTSVALVTNSAIIYLVLKSDADFSVVEHRLRHCLQMFSDASMLYDVFKKLHELNAFVGSFRKRFSQVLKLLSAFISQPPHAGCGDYSAAFLANVTALLFS
jgi:hypothetical protein